MKCFAVALLATLAIGSAYGGLIAHEPLILDPAPIIKVITVAAPPPPPIKVIKVISAPAPPLKLISIPWASPWSGGHGHWAPKPWYSGHWAPKPWYSGHWAPGHWW